MVQNRAGPCRSILTGWWSWVCTPSARPFGSGSASQPRNDSGGAEPIIGTAVRKRLRLVADCVEAFRADPGLQHEPRAGAQLFGLALELAAGGQDVPPARGADRRGVAGSEDDLREAFDALPIRAFIAAARPGIEGNQVDLGRDALQEL